MFPDFTTRAPYEYIKKIFEICGSQNERLVEYDNLKLNDIDDFGFNADFVINYVRDKLYYIGVKPHPALFESCLYVCFIIDKSLSIAQIKRLIDFSVLTVVYDDFLAFNPDKLGNLMADLFSESQVYNINKYYNQVQNDCIQTLETSFLRNEFLKFWTAVPESYFRTITDKPSVNSIKELQTIKRPVTFCDITSLLLADESELQDLSVDKLYVFYKMLDITYYLVLLINDFASYEKEYANGEYDNPILFCESCGKSKSSSFSEVVSFWETYDRELSFVVNNEILPKTGKRLYNAFDAFGIILKNNQQHYFVALELELA